jgi:hypothetical protein
VFLERPGRAPASARPLRAASVLGAIDRELKAVERDRLVNGWTPTLVGRALAAARVLAAYAVRRPVTQRRVAGKTGAADGAVPLPPRSFSRSRIAVSGAVTPVGIVRAMEETPAVKGAAKDRLPALHAALEAFTRARYGAVDARDEPLLDESLTAIRGVGRQLAFEAGALGRTLRVLSAGVASLRSRA